MSNCPDATLQSMFPDTPTDWKRVFGDDWPGTPVRWDAAREEFIEVCQPAPELWCGCMCCVMPDSEVRLGELTEKATGGGTLTDQELAELAGIVQEHCDTALAHPFGADDLNTIQVQAIALVARELWRRRPA
jgi:hypothetical protein